MRDFETLLEFIGSDGMAVSKTNHLLPMKSLADLNARLARPIDLGLKRPRQLSYPHISALYLLLRATGLGRVEGAGNKPHLVSDQETLASWRQLNPTERFCTLLEAGCCGRSRLSWVRGDSAHVVLLASGANFFRKSRPGDYVLPAIDVGRT